MNYINFEENTNAFWGLFDKVFNRENITGISFGEDHGLMCSEISSEVEDEYGEPLESTFRITLDDDGWYRYMVSLTVGDVEYCIGYYVPSKILSEKLGNGLWRTVRKQLRKNLK